VLGGEVTGIELTRFGERLKKKSERQEKHPNSISLIRYNKRPSQNRQISPVNPEVRL